MKSQARLRLRKPQPKHECPCGADMVVLLGSQGRVMVCPQCYRWYLP